VQLEVQRTRAIEINGCQATSARQPSISTMKGAAAITSSPNLRLKVLIATSRFRPTGGVRKPISRLTIMMMPNIILSWP
jgi:hypothetical protein